MSKAAFPSSRQAKCAGLRRGYYQPYLRDLVDYDYDASLPEDAKVWLAAFSEEYYRGWACKDETQLLPKDMGRAANTLHQQRRRNQCPLAFGGLRSDTQVEQGSAGVEDELVRHLDKNRANVIYLNARRRARAAARR